MVYRRKNDNEAQKEGIRNTAGRTRNSNETAGILNETVPVPTAKKVHKAEQ